MQQNMGQRNTINICGGFELVEIWSILVHKFQSDLMFSDPNCTTCKPVVTSFPEHSILLTFNCLCNTILDAIIINRSGNHTPFLWAVGQELLMKRAQSTICSIVLL